MMKKSKIKKSIKVQKLGRVLMIAATFPSLQVSLEI